MKNTSAIVRTKVRTGEKAATGEISKAGIYTVGIASALIGIWGLVLSAVLLPAAAPWQW